MADHKKVEAGRAKLAAYRRKKNSQPSSGKQKLPETDDASVCSELSDLVAKSASTSEGSFVTASSPSSPDITLKIQQSIPSPNSGSTSDGTYVTASNESMNTINEHGDLNRLTARIKELEDIVTGRDAELTALREHLGNVSYRDFSVSVGELSLGLEADYKRNLEKYQNRLEEFEVAVSQRDDLIRQLSEKLKSERRAHVTKEMQLAQDVALLQNQLHATTELVQGHTWDTGIDPHDYLTLQNKMLAMEAAAENNLAEINKLQAGIQSKELALLNKSEEFAKNKASAAREVQELMRQVEVLNQRTSPQQNLTLDDSVLLRLEEDFGLRMCNMKEEVRKQLNTEHSAELSTLHEQLASLGQQCDEFRCIEDKLTSELASYVVEISLIKEQNSKLNDQLSEVREELRCSRKEVVAQVEKSKRDTRKVHEKELVVLRERNEHLEIDLETSRAELDACKEAFIAQWGPDKQARESELVELRQQVVSLKEAIRVDTKQAVLEQERQTLHDDQVGSLKEMVQQLSSQVAEGNTQLAELQARLEEAIVGYEQRIRTMTEEQSALEEKSKQNLLAIDQERKNLDEQYKNKVNVLIQERAAIEDEYKNTIETLVKERSAIEEQCQCKVETLLKEHAVQEGQWTSQIEAVVKEQSVLKKQYDDAISLTIQPTLQEFNVQLQQLHGSLSKETQFNLSEAVISNIPLSETSLEASRDKPFVQIPTLILIRSQLEDGVSAIKAVQDRIIQQQELNVTANALAEDLQARVRDLEAEVARQTDNRQLTEVLGTRNNELESLLLGANLASEALRETCEEKRRVEDALHARIAELEASVREVKEDSLQMRADSDSMTKQIAKAKELLKRMKGERDMMIDRHEKEINDLKSQLQDARTVNQNQLKQLSKQLADFETKHGELFARCQLYETEVSHLRGQLAVSESSLEDLRNQSPRAAAESEPIVSRQRSFASGDAPALFDGSLLFNNTNNNNSTFNNSEYFAVAAPDSNKPFTTSSELEARLEQLHSQILEKEQIQQEFRATKLLLEEKLQEKECNEEEWRATRLLLEASIECLQAQLETMKSHPDNHLELEDKEAKKQLEPAEEVQRDCESKVTIPETVLRKPQEGKEGLRRDLHSVSSEAGFEDLILELESLAKEKVMLTELLRSSEMREKQLSARLVEAELEVDLSATSADQPLEFEERCRKLHSQLEAVHRAHMTLLRLRAQRTLSLREAELHTEYCTQLAVTNKEQLSKLEALQHEVKDRASKIQQLDLEKDEAQSDLDEVKAKLDESQKEIYTMLELKFQHFADKQISAAVNRIQGEHELFRVSQAAVYEQDLDALRTKLEQDKQTQLLRVRQELIQSHDSNVKQLNKMHISERNLADRCPTDSRSAARLLKEVVCREFERSLKGMRETRRLEFRKELAQLTVRLDTAIDSQDFEALLDMGETQVDQAQVMLQAVVKQHADMMEALGEYLDAGQCQLMDFLDTTTQEAETAVTLANLTDQVEQLTQNNQSLKELHKQELQETLDRMNKLLGVECGACIFLRQELELKHKKEVEELRQYFEQKCADVEKHYSEEIFSQHSRKMSSSSSCDEVADLCYTGGASSDQIVKTSEEQNYEDRIAEYRDQLENVKLELAEKYRLQLSTVRAEYESKVEDLVRELAADRQKLDDERHSAELRDLESLHATQLDHLRASLEEKREKDLANLREQLGKEAELQAINLEIQMKEFKDDCEAKNVKDLENLKQKLENDADKMQYDLEKEHACQLSELKTSFEQRLKADLETLTEKMLLAEHEHEERIRERDEARSALAMQEKRALDAESRLHDLEIEQKALSEQIDELTTTIKLGAEQEQDTFLKVQKDMMAGFLMQHKQDIRLLTEQFEAQLGAAQAEIRKLNSEQVEYDELITQSRRRLHAEVQHDVIQALDEQIQALLSEGEVASCPAELQLLLDRLGSRYKQELAALRQELQESKQPTDQQTHHNDRQKPDYRAMASTLKQLVRELSKYVSVCEEELNNTLVRQILQDDESSWEPSEVRDAPDTSSMSVGLPYLSIASDLELTVASDNTFDQSQSPVEMSVTPALRSPKRKVRRVHFAPNIESMLDLDGEAVECSNVSANIRQELDTCLDRFKSETAEVANHNIKQSTEKPNLEVSRLSEELTVARQRIAQLEHREDVTEGYGQQNIERCIDNIAELQEQARSVMKDGHVEPAHLQLMEALCREGDKLVEESKLEREDLQLQVEAADKQLRSTRQFLEDQAAEREQERDDFQLEISKLQDQLRSNDSHRSETQRLAAEVEALEGQVKEATTLLRETEERKEELEVEHKAAVEMVWLLRDIITKLESQVETKTSSEADFEARIYQLETDLQQQIQNNVEIAHQLESSQGETAVHVANLEEQLRLHRLQMEQLQPDPTAVKQMRSTLLECETTLDKKTRDLESLYVTASSAASSPTISEDISIREQVDVMRSSTPDQAALPLGQLLRLQDKLQVHSRAEQAALKRIRDLEMQIRSLTFDRQEISDERDVLQTQTEEQLLKISQLQSNVDEQRSKADDVIQQASSELHKRLHAREMETRDLKEEVDIKDTQLQSVQALLEQTREAAAAQEAELMARLKKEQEYVQKFKKDYKKLKDEKIKEKKHEVEEKRKRVEMDNRRLEEDQRTAESGFIPVSGLLTSMQTADSAVLSKKVSELERQVEALKKQLAECQDPNSKAKRSSPESKDSTQVLYKRDDEGDDGSDADSESDIAELRKQLIDKESVINCLQEQLDGEMERNAAIQHQLNNLAGLQVAYNSLVQATRDIDGLVAERDALRMRLRDDADELDRLRFRVKEAEVMRLERDRLKDQLNELSLLKTAYKKLQDETRDYPVVTSERDLYKSKIKDLTEEVERLHGIEKERDELKRMIGELKEAVDDQEKDIRRQSDVIENLSSSADNKKDRMVQNLSDMRLDLEAKDDRIALLETQLADLPNLEEEIRILKDKLKSTIVSVAQDQDQTNSQLKKLSDSEIRLKSDVGSLQGDLDNERQITKELRAELESVRAELTRLRNEGKSLNQALKRASESMEEKQEALVVARSIEKQLQDAVMQEKVQRKSSEKEMGETIKRLSEEKILAETSFRVKDEQSQNNYEAHKKECEAIQGALDVAQDELKNEKKARREYEEKIRQLEKALTDNGKSIESNRKQSLDLSNEVDQLQTQLDAERRENEKYRNMQADLIKREKEIETFNEKLSNESRELEKQIRDLLAENAKLKNVQSAKTDQDAVVKLQAESIEELKNLDKENCAVQLAKIQALEKKIDLLTKENLGLRDSQSTAREEQAEYREPLDKQLENLQAENDKLQKSISNREEKFESLQKQISDLQAENDQLQNSNKKEKFDSLEKQIRDLQAENDQLQNSNKKEKFDSLEKQIRDLQAENNQLQKSASSKGDNIRALEDKITDVLRECDELVKSNSEKRERIESLLKEVQDLKVENAKLKTPRSDPRIDAAVNSMQKQIEEVARHSSELAKSDKNKQERLAKESDEKIEALEHQVKDLISYSEEFKKLEADANDKSQSLAQQLTELLDENTNLKRTRDEQVKALKNTINQLTSEIDSLNEENDMLKVEINSLKKEIDSLKKENDLLKNKNDSLKNEIDSLKNKNNVFNLKDDSTKEEIGTLKNENYLFKIGEDSEKEAIGSLKNKSNVVKSDDDLTKEEFDSMKNENNVVKSDDDSTKEEMDSVKNENNVLKTDDDSTKEESDSVKNENNVLTRDDDSTKEETDSVKNDYGSTNIEIDSLETGNGPLEKETDSLKTPQTLGTIGHATGPLTDSERNQLTAIIKQLELQVKTLQARLAEYAKDDPNGKGRSIDVHKKSENVEEGGLKPAGKQVGGILEARNAEYERRISEKQQDANKIHNANLAELMATFERDKKALCDRHNQSVLRLQEMHEDEVCDMRCEYESEMKIIRSALTDSQKVIKQYKTDMDMLKRKNEECCRLLCNKHQEEKETMMKLFAGNVDSMAKDETEKRGADLKRLRDKDQKKMEYMKAKYIEVIEEEQCKHSAELERLRVYYQQEIECMREQLKMLPEEEQQKCSRSLELSKTEVYEKQPEGAEAYDASQFQGASTNLYDILNKALKDGIQSLVYEELSILHASIRSETGKLIAAQPGLKIITAMRDSDQQQLCSRIASLEHEISRQEQDTRVKVGSLESSVRNEQRRVSDMKQTLTQQNAEMRSQLDSLMQQQAGLEQERDLFKKQTDYFEGRAIHAIQNLEREKAVNRAVEEELLKERNNAELLQAMLQEERSRLSNANLQEAEMTRCLRLRLEASMANEAKLKSRLAELDIRHQKQEPTKETTSKFPRNQVNSSNANAELKAELETEKEHSARFEQALREEQRQTEQLQLALAQERRLAQRFEAEREKKRDLRLQLDILKNEKESIESKLDFAQERLSSQRAEAENREQKIQSLEAVAQRRELLSKQEEERARIALENALTKQFELQQRVFELEQEVMEMRFQPNSLSPPEKSRQLPEPSVSVTLLSKIKTMNEILEKHVVENSNIAEAMSRMKLERRQLLDRVAHLEDTLKDRGSREMEIVDAIMSAERASWGKERTLLLHNLTKSEAKRKAANNNTVDAEQTRHLFGQYMRVQSFLKALIWQKRYLMLVISGYQQLEKEVLTKFPSTHQNGGPVNGSRGINKFRSCAMAVIAVQRMKFLVRRWRHGRAVGSSTLLLHGATSNSSSKLPRVRFASVDEINHYEVDNMSSLSNSTTGPVPHAHVDFYDRFEQLQQRLGLTSHQPPG